MSLLLTLLCLAAADVLPASSYPLPERVERVLELAPGKDNPRNSEGDFIQLKDGRILFVYTYFCGGTGDHDAAILKARVSSDRGQTWSAKDTTLVDNEGGMNVMSISLLRLQNGNIGLFYLRKNTLDECMPYMRISTDEAQSWSEATCCVPKEHIGYYVVNNDRVVQLKDGRLLVPAARHAVKGGPRTPGMVFCFWSDDNGKTWTRTDKALVLPEDKGKQQNKDGLQEPGIVELSDGRLLMLHRTSKGVFYCSYSSDRGESWTEPAPTDLCTPLSPGSIERIPSTGDLLLVWNDLSHQHRMFRKKRTPLTVAISKDDGQTWIKKKNLETDPNGWYCYTAIEFVDNHVLLGHCAGDRSKYNGLERTEVLRFPVSWLYE